MKKLLVVIDMQNDFLTGVLGSETASSILPNVINKIKQYKNTGDTIVFTKDTHSDNYLQTKEGENLPIPHCMYESKGWEFPDELLPHTKDCLCFFKPSFGSTALGEFVKETHFDQIEVIGVCTDICVITNTLLLKSFSPESEIIVDSSCCAGVTKEHHNIALEAMKQCHITIL